MDPLNLSTITTALTALASEVAKGLGGGVGKDLWTKAKALLGWQSEPPTADLPKAIATTLEKDPAVALEILKLLKSAPASETSAGALVGKIDAQKVVVAQRLDVGGDLTM